MFKHKMDKILNPKTGRYVQKGGKIGQQIIQKQKENKKKTQKQKGGKTGQQIIQKQKENKKKNQKQKGGFDDEKKPCHERDEMCPVCMEETYTEETDWKKLPCGHCLCTTCFQQLVVPKKCPLCRKDIEPPINIINNTEPLYISNNSLYISLPASLERIQIKLEELGNLLNQIRHIEIKPTRPSLFQSSNALPINDVNQLFSLILRNMNPRNITKLQIYYPIISLPDSIGTFTNLTELEVGGDEDANNDWSRLPQYNPLTSLPDSIGDLRNLTKLYLDGNHLRSLPQSIGNLRNLTLTSVITTCLLLSLLLRIVQPSRQRVVPNETRHHHQVLQLDCSSQRQYLPSLGA